jgi:hypothetical protein
MAIPIVVALWADPGFQGTKRTIVENTPDLRFQAFDNVTSAIGIHPGPDFASFDLEPLQPTVTFFEHPVGFPNGMGRSLTLGPGVYSNIHGIGFGDMISSVQFNLTDPVALGGTDPHGEHVILEPDGNAATISPIPFIIELFTDSNPLNRDTPEDTLGNKLVIVESTSDVVKLYIYELLLIVTTGNIHSRKMTLNLLKSRRFYRSPLY